MRNPWEEFGFGAGPGPGPKWWWGGGWSGRGGRRRAQMFESGEVKFVILRLLKEKPRHGYEVIKALEERMGGCYTPSAGTVYPTLQLLEDEGYVRAVETDGKKVYHVTPEGERFLDEHRDLLDDIIARVRETVRDFAGGAMGDLHSAFARVATTTFKRAWRRGPEDPAIQRVTEILRRAADDIEKAWQGTSSGERP
ncbi:MAG TPA: PadR family transcriptional regulator [Gemmatimonadales bacterium]|nr:PadR family transcriptional regulator [Gemmatimonadales bacterium]